MKHAAKTHQEVYGKTAHPKTKTIKWLAIGAVTIIALLVIGGYFFLRSKDRLPLYSDLLHDMMRHASFGVASFQVYLAESRYEQLFGGPSRFQVNSNLDESIVEELRNKKTLLDEEVVDEFQKWIASDMTAGFKEVPVREANLIRKNAPSITDMIRDISYSRQQLQPPNEIPDSGFISGCVARIGVNNKNEQVLLVGPIVSSTMYNTLRLNETERAELVVKEQVLKSLRALYDCAESIGVKHVGIVFGYISKDFLNEELTNFEALGFITAIEDCQQFLEHDIPQEELFRRAELFLFDREFNIKRIELTF